MPVLHIAHALSCRFVQIDCSLRVALSADGSLPVRSANMCSVQRLRHAKPLLHSVRQGCKFRTHDPCASPNQRAGTRISKLLANTEHVCFCAQASFGSCIGVRCKWKWTSSVRSQASPQRHRWPCWLWTLMTHAQQQTARLKCSTPPLQLQLRLQKVLTAPA